MKTTFILIVINIIFFIAVISLLPLIGSETFVSFFRTNIALTPSTFLEHPWTIITSMFMHAPGAPLVLFSAHLFVNMISLFFLGSFLERIIGRRRFLGVYILGGLAGGLLLLLLAYVSKDPRIISLSFFVNPAITEVSAVGASAAIFALAGCLTILTPRVPVLVFFLLPMKLWQAIIFLLLVLTMIPGIANSAHLGGLLVGAAYGLFLRKRYKNKIVLLNRLLAGR